MSSSGKILYKINHTFYDAKTYSGEEINITLNKIFNIDKITDDELPLLEDVNFNSMEFRCMTIEIPLNQFGDMKDNRVETISKKFEGFAKTIITTINKNAVFIQLYDGINMTYCSFNSYHNKPSFVINNIKSKLHISQVVGKIKLILK